MRILFLTNHLIVGGIETNLLLLTGELVRAGHEVIVGARGGVLAPRLTAAGGRHVLLEMRLGDPGAILRDVRNLRRILREERPDVVHSFSATASALLWLARPFAGVRRAPPRTFASLMGLALSDREPKLRVYARAHLTTLAARKVFVISPMIRRTLERLPLRRSRLIDQRVVGVRTDLGARLPAEQAARVRAEIGFPPDVPLVITIGRLEVSKAHHLFVEAAARFLGAGRAASFAIVGGGTMRPQLDALINAKGVGGSLRILGERMDIARLLAASDVCVRPGVVEGFIGITVLEAQSMGIPVVSFDTVDVREAIRDNGTGLLVPPGDVDAMATAIARLLDDPAFAASLADAGRDLVERRFSIRAVASELAERYREA